MASNPTTTSFMIIYDSFLARITDDMYLELTELDTIEMLQEILINAIPRFEFPRKDLFDYDEGHWEDLGDYCGIESDDKEVPATGWVGGIFNCGLTQEEINIIALNMVVEWLGQQLNTTELSKMKYTGSDFKLTSQANHMAKLKVLIDAQTKDSLHLQRIYKRRRFVNGSSQSTMGDIVSKSDYGVTSDKINSTSKLGFWTRGSV